MGRAFGKGFAGSTADSRDDMKSSSLSTVTGFRYELIVAVEVSATTFLGFFETALDFDAVEVDFLPGT